LKQGSPSSGGLSGLSVRCHTLPAHKVAEYSVKQGMALMAGMAAGLLCDRRKMMVSSCFRCLRLLTPPRPLSTVEAYPPPFYFPVWISSTLYLIPFQLSHQFIATAAISHFHIALRLARISVAPQLQSYHSRRAAATRTLADANPHDPIRHDR